MKTVLCILLLGAFALANAAETNVTGKWTGSFNISGPEGQTKETSALLVLKQTGTDITGTVGPDEGEQHAITKGKVEGDKISILIDEDGRTIKFDLVAKADRITGNVNISHDGQTLTAKLDVTKTK
jgi:hypothetical protein